MAKSSLLAKQASAMLRCAPYSALLRHRNPDLEAAIAGDRIELFVVALEVRRIRGLVAGCRQPVIPDRADGAPDRRHMVAMGEHRIALLGDADAHVAARQVG